MRSGIVDYLNRLWSGGPWGLVVPTPAVVYLIAISVVLLLFVRRSGADGLSRYHALGAAVWGMGGGVVGARLLHLLLRADQVLADPAMLFNVSGTTMSWGAYVGGGIGFFSYFARHHQAAGPYADVAASVFGLGPFIGRFACFLNGDDFGTVSTVPWAVTYPSGSYAMTQHVDLGLLHPSAAGSLPVHPVQLYLAANGLVLFVILSWIWRRKRYPTGDLMLMYWAAYGITRFGLEFWRGDLHRTFVGSYPDAQVIALVVGVASIAMLVLSAWQRRPRVHVGRPRGLEA